MRFFWSLLFFISTTVCFSQQSEPEPWDKLGLSKTEWLLIKDNNISTEKVEQLLKSGIEIGEYLNKPWEPIGLTETQWISKKRSGMTSYNIELEATQPPDTRKSDLKQGVLSDINNMSGTGEAFSSLFLPGYQQMKAQRKAHGIIMVSLAATSLTLCTVQSISRKQFAAWPVFCVLVPDMVWSYIDHKVFSNRKKFEN